MNKLISNINELLRRDGLASINELAERAKMQQPTLSRIYTGKSASPRDDTLRPLAKYAGVELHVLRYGDLSAPVQIPAYEIRGVSSEDDADEQDVLIDVVDVELSAGPGRIVPEYRPTSRQLAFSREWITRKRYKVSALKVMPVHGDSMLPKLSDGDTVLVNTADTRIVDGRIYALVIGHEAKIKTLRRGADGSLIVISENPDKRTYPDDVVPPTDANDVYIIGRAVQRAGDL